MLKPTVKRSLMLDFIPDEINFALQINPNRIFQLNDKKIGSGDVVYISSREFRVEDNWAIIFAYDLAIKYNKHFKVIILLDNNYYSKCQLDFMMEGLSFFKKNLAHNHIDFEVMTGIPKNLNAGAIVVDFNPINLNYDFAKHQKCSVFEVDSHNIIPARFISNKQEYSAATLRRKVYANIADFLTELPDLFGINENFAKDKLDDFIANKLDNYAEFKNDPTKDMTSNMSPYLHFGFISAQRIALEIIKSKSTRENKEAFLEELIVRKELSDNFCLYNPNYKSLKGAPSWAQITLDNHKNDIRTYIYELSEFEYAKTHDVLWNKIQQNLLITGRIHGYLRMYWAKKILEWSITPEEALHIAIYLNDKYALDGNDPNGYVGMLWSIGGLHDRAFANKNVTGKIRCMSLDGCKKKFDVNEYIKNEAMD